VEIKNNPKQNNLKQLNLVWVGIIIGKTTATAATAAATATTNAAANAAANAASTTAATAAATATATATIGSFTNKMKNSHCTTSKQLNQCWQCHCHCHHRVLKKNY
jgi:hypothetical protein